MKITMNNGITFEGTQAEYEAFLAFAERIVAEEEAQESQAEVEAYEKAAHKASFAVGDYVKVVKSKRGNEGKIVKITEVSDESKMRRVSGDVVSADFHVKSLDGELYGLTADQIVKANDAEIAKATAPKLKAGDFVKFSDNDMGITAGKLYEVYEKYGELSLTDDDGDWRHGGVFSDKYEILSAEEAKWAKIGRKVNEFKKGDVVRVFDNMAISVPIGSLATITHDQITNRPQAEAVSARNGDLRSFWLGVEIVAPVESTVA